MATRRLVYNGGISKIRRNNSIVPNFVMKVDHTGHTKFWPHRLNSERVTAVQSFEEIVRKMVNKTQEEEDHRKGYLSAQGKIWCKAMIYFKTDFCRIWCRFHKHSFGWEQDIVVCFLYIPPSDSNWYRNGKSCEGQLKHQDKFTSVARF